MGCNSEMTDFPGWKLRIVVFSAFTRENSNRILCLNIRTLECCVDMLHSVEVSPRGMYGRKVGSTWETSHLQYAFLLLAKPEIPMWPLHLMWQFAECRNDISGKLSVFERLPSTIPFRITGLWLTFWRRIFFFQILAHPVFKMWVIQKPNKVTLWNKRHFEEKKNGDYTACLKYSVRIFVE